MGRIVPELDESNIRELILRNYRIIYRILGDMIQIVRLFHGSRIMDFKFLLKLTSNLSLNKII